MKKAVSILLSCAFCCALISCGGKSPSSAGTSESLPASQTASSAAQAESSSAAASVSSSEAASSSSEAASDTGGTADISFPYTTAGGSQVTVELTVPDTWEYDGYATFTDSQSGLKCMEFAAVYEISDPSQPITDEMRSPFQTTSEGLDQSAMFHGESFAVTRPVEYYRTAGAPDGADGTFTWYVFFTFCYDEQYVYQMHFYTTDENANISSFSHIIASAHAQA